MRKTVTILLLVLSLWIIFVPSVFAERGNSSGNIGNFGKVAQQGDWIYYRSNNSLVKMKNDGSEEQILCDGKVDFINAAGDWIYFNAYGSDDNTQDTGLHRIKTDGSEKQKLDNNMASYINVVDDWIYYVNRGDLCSLYKMRTDGSERQKIHPYAMEDVTVADGWVYFINGSDGYSLCRMKIDGTQLTELAGRLPENPVIDHDWIFYNDSNHLYKMKTDGTQKQILDKAKITYVNIEGDWIYYVTYNVDNGNNVLYKMKTDGSQKTKLLENDRIYSINIAAGWIYFDYYTNHEGIGREAVCRIRTDGSQMERFEMHTTFDVKFLINGESITFTDVPVPVNGEVLLPLNDVLVNLGIKDDEQHVQWHEEEQRITINEGGKTIKLQIGSSIAYVNDVAVELVEMPIIYKDKPHIPAWFVLQNLGKKVVWNKDTATYLVSDEQEFNKVKEILEKSYQAMNEADRYKLEQKVDAIVSYGEETATMEVKTFTQIDQENEIFSQNVKRNMKIKHSTETSEIDIWFENNTLYIKQPPENIWRQITLTEAAKEQKPSQMSNSYYFLEPNEMLCAGLKAEKDSNRKEWILKGAVVPGRMVEVLLSEANIEPKDIVNAYMEIHIDKQKYYINEVSMRVECELDISLDMTAVWTTSDINGNFTITVPKEIKQASKAVEEVNVTEEIEKGDGLFEAGDFDGAIKSYDKAIEADARVADAYGGKAMTLYHLNRFEESITVLDQYIVLRPKDDDAVVWKAQNYIYLNEYDKALDLCEQVIEQNARNDFAYNVKGLAYLRKGRYNDALGAFDKAIEIDNRYEDAYVNKITALYYQKSYSECIAFADKAGKLFEDNEDIPWLKAQCYSEQYKHDEAVKAYEDVLAINPNNDTVAVRLGWEYYILQDYDKGFEYAEKALSINDQSPSALALKAALEKTKLPQAQRIVDFVKENYLYVKQIAAFEDKSKAFMNKKQVNLQDIQDYIDAIKVEGDIFTLVVGGDEYEALANRKDADHISYKRLDKNKEYIRINSFDYDVGLAFKTILNKIEKPESKTLIIDLRDNGGGLIDISNDILDYLLPGCMTSFIIDRDGYISPYYSNENQTAFEKIIVMVNEHSASSSELLALGLKKYLNNVVIIGRPTVGKGVGQIIYEDKKRKYIIYLVNHHWNVKEENINDSQIVPDIHIEGSEDSDYFEVIDRLTAKQR